MRIEVAGRFPPPISEVMAAAENGCFCVIKAQRDYAALDANRFQPSATPSLPFSPCTACTPVFDLGEFQRKRLVGRTPWRREMGVGGGVLKIWSPPPHKKFRGKKKNFLGGAKTPVNQPPKKKNAFFFWGRGFFFFCPSLSFGGR